MGYKRGILVGDPKGDPKGVPKEDPKGDPKKFMVHSGMGKYYLPM